MQLSAAPVFPQTILDALEKAGGRPCFEQGDGCVTAAETLAMIRRIAGGMRAAGFRPGTGLAVLPGVTPAGFAAMMAGYALGLRLHAVRPGLTPDQLAHLLHGGVDAVVLDPSAAGQLTVAPGVPVYSLGPHSGATDLLAHPDDGLTPVAVGRPGDIARVNYTSGSTGVPKGCAATYGGLGSDWQVNPASWSPAMSRLAAGLDRVLLFGTFASPVVMNFVLLSFLHGGVAVIPDPAPGPLLPGALARHRITGSILTVPRLYHLLDALRVEQVDVSSLRTLMVSGSPLHPGRLAQARRVLGPVVFNAYGQTEAGALSLLTPDDLARDGQAALTSVGRPHPAVEVSLRDPQGREVPAGSGGEIYVRTPWQSAGYWGDPGQTAEVYLDGWVRTRDLGHLDSLGYLHLTGRTREIIIVNAMVYYAGPIEQVLAEHPGVDEAYVVAVPDEATGEAVHALVVASPGGPPPVDELRDLVRARLGEGSVPQRVTFIPEAIAAPSGKPDKRAMLARYATAGEAVPVTERPVPSTVDHGAVTRLTS